MTRYLLDVNVLIALIDPIHITHDQAHAWFATLGAKAWATCPITQNGVLRIVGNPRYPGSPGSPAAVATVLSAFLSHPGHEFWPNDISLFDKEWVDASSLLNASQVTDSYLLALAVKHGGKLATFDRQLVTNAVKSGFQSVHFIA